MKRTIRASSKWAGDRRGFSLIELMVVVILTGILLAAATPNIRRSLSFYHLKSFSADFQTRLQEVQQKASRTQRIFCLYIDQDRRLYAVYPQQDADHQEVYFFPEDVTVSSQPATILFFPDSTISTAQVKFEDARKNEIVLTTKGFYGQTREARP